MRLIIFLIVLFIGFYGYAQKGTNEAPLSASINIQTRAGHTIQTGASGFNVRIGDKAWSYKHPDFIQTVNELKPGWLRYWSGTAGDAFCMATGMYDKEYINMFDKGDSFERLYQFVEVKGPHRITDLYALMGTVGGKIVVTINGFTESPEMTGELANFCKNNNIVVDVWQFCNEPYFYIPTRQRYWWNDGYDYAQKMKPHADAIKKVFPDAKMALNFTWDNIWDFMKQINKYQVEKGAFWNVFSKHSYAPHVGDTMTFENAYQRGNTKIIEVTSDNAMKQIEQWTKPGISLLITEFGVWNKPLEGIYSALYNAEYTLRQLAHPNAYLIGSHEVSNKFKPAVSFNQEILDAFKNKTPLNTLNLKTGIYKTDEGKAMQIVHEAINNSNYVYQTNLTNPVMVNGMKNAQEIGNYAMAFKGTNGFDYLAVTNRSGKYQEFSLNQDGSPLNKTFEVQYVWSAEAQKENIDIVSKTFSGNVAEVPPYSLMVLKWKSDLKTAPVASRIYDTKIVKNGVSLTWWKRENADSYQISYTNNKYKTLKNIIVKGENNYTLTELTKGLNYTFNVRAINQYGASDVSPNVYANYNLPIAPTIFKIAPRDNELTVFWHSVPNASGYKVIIKLGSETKIYDADNVFGFKVKDLKFDKPYLVSVKAYNGLGDGISSKSVTSICKKNIPYPAHNISAIENADGTIALKWDEPNITTQNTKYRLYRGTQLYNLKPFAESITATNYTDKDLQKGTDYFYSVKAYTTDGENSFFPNTATIIKSSNQAFVKVSEIKQLNDVVTVTVNFKNVNLDGDVVYGITLNDVSYLNGEDLNFTTLKANNGVFTISIPADKLAKKRAYTVKGFVKTNGGTPITSLPPLKEFKIQ